VTIEVTFDVSGFKIPPIMQSIERTVLAVNNKIAADAFANIVRATPVDTGRARAGWTFTPATSAYSTATIANNVDYVIYLNQGSSQQAPARFVELGMQAAAAPFVG
jgi:hypothetical protein